MLILHLVIFEKCSNVNNTKVNLDLYSQSKLIKISKKFAKWKYELILGINWPKELLISKPLLETFIKLHLMLTSHKHTHTYEHTHAYTQAHSILKMQTTNIMPSHTSILQTQYFINKLSNKKISRFLNRRKLLSREEAFFPDCLLFLRLPCKFYFCYSIIVISLKEQAL